MANYGSQNLSRLLRETRFSSAATSLVVLPNQLVLAFGDKHLRVFARRQHDLILRVTRHFCLWYQEHNITVGSQTYKAGTCPIAKALLLWAAFNHVDVTAERDEYGNAWGARCYHPISTGAMGVAYASGVQEVQPVLVDAVGAARYVRFGVDDIFA